MNELERNYDVTRRDLAKDKALRYGAWTMPPLLAIVPALIFFALGLLSVGAPPTVAVFFTFAVISLIAGFLIGAAISGGLMVYRSRWLAEMRERIAVDGIRAEEVQWFTPELRTAEKKSLRELERANRLLADAYRETLASRLTATRIVKKSKLELLLVRKRENKLKYLKSGRGADFQDELKRDRARLEEINREAREMNAEAETRLQMIEAAAARGTTFADSELALKKLSARAEQLPLALEALKMEEDARRELEAEDDAANAEAETDTPENEN